MSDRLKVTCSCKLACAAEKVGGGACSVVDALKNIGNLKQKSCNDELVAHIKSIGTCSQGAYREVHGLHDGTTVDEISAAKTHRKRTFSTKPSLNESSALLAGMITSSLTAAGRKHPWAVWRDTTSSSISK